MRTLLTDNFQIIGEQFSKTWLASVLFADLLDKLDSNRVIVNYDTGNNASLGYDPVKDRLMYGGSVMLGTGATDFEKFFSAPAKTGYKGVFIMQAYWDDEGVGILKNSWNG